MDDVKPIDVVGPIGNPKSAGGWFGILEKGILSQSRFPDAPAAWVAWREYSLRTGGGDGGGRGIARKLKG